MPNAPIRYTPTAEQPEPDEARTQQDLVDTLRGISETTSKDYGRAVRSVHAKSHALLRGELRVLDGLPDTLAQGLFARPATYPAVLRLSSNPGDLLDDSLNASLPRGLAVKVIGVEGERLPGSEDAVTQDFVMVDGPAFVAPDARKFLGNLKLLARTTDTPQVFKKILSSALRGAETVLEAFGGESATLKALGGHRHTHPLGATFYSQVPFLHGPYIAKLSIAPVSPDLTALTDATVSIKGRTDALREDLAAFFREHGGEWDVRVQLCTDLEAMPVEDASVPWPEDQSPYLPVARLSVPPQESWSQALDERLAFSVWHGLAAHRPLGSINRARKAAYEMSAGFRASHNGCPVTEPRSLAALDG